MKRRPAFKLPAAFWYQFALWNAAQYRVCGEKFYPGLQLERHHRPKKVAVKKLPCYSTIK